ncbi:hypothetical protein [Bacillus sonorensis]|nr:hypothetical protein [Bacillus sonorensis]
MIIEPLAFVEGEWLLVFEKKERFPNEDKGDYKKVLEFAKIA